MTILIVKENQSFFETLMPGIKFEDNTEHTCTFKVPQKKFQELYDAVKKTGNNPYAVMSW